MKAFWIPSKTPEARILVDKPDQEKQRSASGAKLRSMHRIMSQSLGSTRAQLLQHTGDQGVLDAVQDARGTHLGRQAGPGDAVSSQRGQVTLQGPDRPILPADDKLICCSMQEMKAFWMPSKTPEARILVDKPDQETRCPASGVKLRFKELTILKFTRPPPGEESSCFAVDPVTNDALTNAHKLVVLKPTGS